MNVAGIILDIIAIIFAFVPIFGSFIAIPCIAIGLPLSAVDFVKKKNRGEGLGIAIAGVATNIVALVITISWASLVGTGIAAGGS